MEQDARNRILVELLEHHAKNARELHAWLSTTLTGNGAFAQAVECVQSLAFVTAVLEELVTQSIARSPELVERLRELAEDHSAIVEKELVPLIAADVVAEHDPDIVFSHTEQCECIECSMRKLRVFNGGWASKDGETQQ